MAFRGLPWTFQGVAERFRDVFEKASDDFWRVSEALIGVFSGFGGFQVRCMESEGF